MDNNGAFGLPLSCDDAILCTEHNRDVYEQYAYLCRLCAKKAKKGVTLDTNYLAHSSMMKKLCSAAFKAAIETTRTPQGTTDYCAYIANKIVSEVNSGQWD